MRVTNWLSLSLIGSWLVGCAVGPNYHAPDTAMPQAFIAIPTPPASIDAAASSGPATPIDPTASADGTDTPGSARSAARAPSALPASPQAQLHATVDLSQWWRSLGDAELDSLVDRTIRDNPDANIALTHLQEVRTLEAVRSSAALPEMTVSAAVGSGTGSDLTLAGAAPGLREADNKGSLQRIRQIAGFSASWELDLFGGYRRAIEAGGYDVGAAAAARDVVLISVIADMVRNYLDMRGLQTRISILRDSIAAAAQSRDLQQQRFDRGLTNELDLQLANRELSTLRAELPPLASEIDSDQYDIAVLLGRYPEDLAAELAPGRLPSVPDHIDPGLPLELLQRRPDVREAERRLAAATARIGVATANLFPHLTLNGGLGTQSATPGIQGSHIWAFGPALYWPVLDFGALDAQVGVADLRAQGQLIAYKQAIVAAVRDADSAIADYSAQQQRVKDLGDARVASERAVAVARQRYDRGLTDFLNVVDAERQQYTLEDEYAASRQRAAETFVNLCRALGGGWQPYQNIPSIRRAEPAVIAAFHRLLTGSNSASTAEGDGKPQPAGPAN